MMIPVSTLMSSLREPQCHPVVDLMMVCRDGPNDVLNENLMNLKDALTDKGR